MKIILIRPKKGYIMDNAHHLLPTAQIITTIILFNNIINYQLYYNNLSLFFI